MHVYVFVCGRCLKYCHERVTSQKCRCVPASCSVQRAPALCEPTSTIRGTFLERAQNRAIGFFQRMSRWRMYSNRRPAYNFKEKITAYTSSLVISHISRLVSVSCIIPLDVWKSCGLRSPSCCAMNTSCISVIVDNLLSPFRLVYQSTIQLPARERGNMKYYPFNTRAVVA